MKVLIVEDERKMREMLQEVLRREGHVSTLAASGKAGLEFALASDFDAIVLDRMLPEMDGDEVVRRLRLSSCSTPILMLTARDTVGDVVSGLDSGVDDYLTKPFAIAELLARLRALRRRQPQMQAQVLRYGPLELNDDRQEVTCHGKILRLTRTEFRIMEYMLRQPERVHYRDAIINVIWGDQCTVEANTLDVFIKQLRSKTEAQGAPRLIHTVRGLGYRLAGG